MEEFIMLKLILCDDDTFTLRTFSRLLIKAGEQFQIPLEIKCQASNARELLRFLDCNPDTYLFFLDLDMGSRELNGLDIGRLIREKTPGSRIVYVTSHTEKTMDILKSGVEPFYFVEKDFNQDMMILEFGKCLKKACGLPGGFSDDTGEEKSIRLPIGLDETISVPVRRITFVEALKASAHNICYHTLDGSQITVRDTIKNALSALGDGFVQTHRSVIVNRIYIIGVENAQVKLSNGETVACALSKLNEFSKYSRKQGGN